MANSRIPGSGSFLRSSKAPGEETQIRGDSGSRLPTAPPWWREPGVPDPLSSRGAGGRGTSPRPHLLCLPGLGGCSPTPPVPRPRLLGASGGVSGCEPPSHTPEVGWEGRRQTRGCLLENSRFVSTLFTIWDTAWGW